MLRKHIIKCLFLFLSLPAFLACSNSEEDYVAVPAIKSPVVMDLTVVPYTNLSEYKFFTGDLKNQKPSYGVIPYKPASSLFSDYAEKKRFLWLPKGTKATYNTDGKILELPVGAALIKTFYYNKVQPSNTTKILETRVMIRKSTGWIYAEYIWNQAQTEAVLNMNGSNINISWKDDNDNIKTTEYRIPSAAECAICHSIKINEVYTPLPIGIKPQNLNFNYNYTTGSKNQLKKLIELGYLENNLPENIVSVVDYNDTSKSLDLRVRSYFDINCAHCHQIGGYADFFDVQFSFNLTNIPTNMGVCVTPNHFVPGQTGDIVKPHDIARSILYYRMVTDEFNFRMPFLGRSIPHEEGIQLVEDWINSLTDCE